VILFDGQKQYPMAKVTVDFTFVEHLDHDCIEIIGICIPFENIQKTNSKTDKNNNYNGECKNTTVVINSIIPDFGATPITPPHTHTQGVVVSSSNSVINAGLTTVGLYSMTNEEKQLLPIIRIYIAAKAFYEKIILNKKMKDKKNRRTEQVLTLNSKLTQNMASQSLLGAISVFNNPAAAGNFSRRNSVVMDDKNENNDANNNNNNNKIDLNNNTNNNKEIPPFLMKIFMSDVPLDYKTTSDFGNNFLMHNPYEKLERGSKRNIESLKRRISYNALDFDPSITSRRGSNGAFEDFYENIFGSDQPQIVIPEPVQVHGFIIAYDYFYFIRFLFYFVTLPPSFPSSPSPHPPRLFPSLSFPSFLPSLPRRQYPSYLRSIVSTNCPLLTLSASPYPHPGNAKHYIVIVYPLFYVYILLSQFSTFFLFHFFLLPFISFFLFSCFTQFIYLINYYLALLSFSLQYFTFNISPFSDSLQSPKHFSWLTRTPPISKTPLSKYCR
jgi:hypothetical protein